MIYLDNAATSFPKPSNVCSAVYKYMTSCGANAGRSSHKMARRAMEVVWDCRDELAQFFGVQNPQNIVFATNTTHALNTAVLGMVPPGGHVIVSCLEHNSSVRPLYKIHAEISVLPLSEDGSCNIAALPEHIRPDTKLVIINHASNVSGVVNDISLAASLCKSYQIPLLIDAAQTAGILPLSFDTLGAFVAFPGHKSLLGPQGTGGLYIPPIYSPAPLMCGGTGSNSESLEQPQILPDYYESGTQNVPAIAGLLEGVRYIRRKGRDLIYAHEAALAGQIIDGLKHIPQVSVLCPDAPQRVATVSFTVRQRDTSEICERLDEEYDIACRAGLHCAPLAHRSYHTLETGTVRVSPGYFTTTREIDTFLNAVEHIVSH